MDVRIVAEDAKLGFVFTRRGITPEGCSTWFLPRLVGMATAVDWMCSGRMFGAAEAVATGLVTAAVPAVDVLPATLRLAHRLSEQSAPVAAATTLGLLRQMAFASSPNVAHVAESVALAELGGSADAQEGVRAFLERREPHFTGRMSADAPSPVGSVVPEWAREFDR
jgi:enoyl-CoA hydratase/carnithine racemase